MIKRFTRSGKQGSVIWGVIAGMVFSVTSAAEAKGILRARQPIPGQYIVIFRGQVESVGEFDFLLDRMLKKYPMQTLGTWRHAVKGFVARMSAAQATALANDPNVALVEEDGIVSIGATQTGATWGLDRIDQRDLPLNGNYTYDGDGTGVTAYVIDTGIRMTHSEFGGRAKSGFTAIGDGRGTDDCHGHGTHVAGTLGGNGYGVAKGVALMAVRVLDCTGSGSTSGVISGVNWVTANKKLPAVANMSLGGGVSSALDTAVQNSISAGIVYTVAAGNDNRNACNGSPARVASALTVGATTSTDARASYSNYGACVDLFAPGSGIRSASNKDDTATQTMSGTSMAAPHVAGAAALYLASRPGATPGDVAIVLTTNATQDRIANVGSSSPNRLLYTGFIDAGASDTTPPFIRLTQPASGASLQGQVQLAAEASDAGGIANVEFRVDNIVVATDANAPYQVTWNSATVVDGSHAFDAIATDLSGNKAVSNTVNATTANGGVQTACANSTQLIGNPGFEAGPSIWAASTGVIDNTNTAAPARSGSWKAWLNGYGTSHTDDLDQQITIPADACSVALSFWLWISSSEGSSAPARDTLTVTVRDAAGTVLRTLATYSNRDRTSGYVRKSFDLAPYKGQTVRLHFRGVENASRATSFLIDDTALDVVQ